MHLREYFAICPVAVNEQFITFLQNSQQIMQATPEKAYSIKTLWNEKCGLLRALYVMVLG